MLMPNLTVLVPATKHITANIRVSKQLGNDVISVRLQTVQDFLVGVANRNGIQSPLRHRTIEPVLRCLRGAKRTLCSAESGWTQKQQTYQHFDVWK